ncbi:hypothetical protein J6590_008547 [Homalodisca vitripennis]|nr:hypothetical protein J6590_008547 [Homalodisca vitripennis]
MEIANKSSEDNGTPFRNSELIAHSPEGEDANPLEMDLGISVYQPEDDGTGKGITKSLFPTKHKSGKRRMGLLNTSPEVTVHKRAVEEMSRTTTPDLSMLALNTKKGHVGVPAIHAGAPILSTSMPQAVRDHKKERPWLLTSAEEKPKKGEVDRADRRQFLQVHQDDTIKAKSPK